MLPCACYVMWFVYVCRMLTSESCVFLFLWGCKAATFWGLAFLLATSLHDINHWAKTSSLRKVSSEVIETWLCECVCVLQLVSDWSPAAAPVEVIQDDAPPLQCAGISWISTLFSPLLGLILTLLPLLSFSHRPCCIEKGGGLGVQQVCWLTVTCTSAYVTIFITCVSCFLDWNKITDQRCWNSLNVLIFIEWHLRRLLDFEPVDWPWHRYFSRDLSRYTGLPSARGPPLSHCNVTAGTIENCLTDVL